MRLILTIISIAILSGCALISKPNSELEAKTAQARMQACVTREVARYAALVEIAKAGDNSAKIAAVMSMQQIDKCQELK